MKSVLLAVFTMAVGLSQLPAQTSPAGQAQGQTPQPTAFRIVEKGLNNRVWQRETYEMSPNGTVVTRVHKYNEMATGLYFEQNGALVESKEEIDMLADGSAAATNGQHKVYFPADIYQGSISLTTPVGQQMQSEPVLLCYVDGTNSVILADLQDSDGELADSNKLVYPNAFHGIQADLLYTYRKSGFEQDVILKQRPPSPQLYGLNPATTRLEMITEVSSPTEPGIQTGASDQADNLRDSTLHFDGMTMVQGRAFSVTNTIDRRNGGVPVFKNWLHAQGRTFLVEKVPFKLIAKELVGLAENTGNSNKALLAKVPLDQALNQLAASAGHIAKSKGKKPLISQTKYHFRKGVVLDYIILNGSPGNVTFQADTTYLMGNTYYSPGSVTFEGGTVIKFTSNAGGFNAGSVSFETSPTRPAVFTASDDNSIGETISGSTGVPSGYYGYNIIFDDYGQNVEIHDVRISYLNSGFQTYGNSLQLDNFQAVDCNVPAVSYFNNVSVNNGLFYKDAYGIYQQAGTPTVYGTQVTAHDCGTFSQAGGLTLVNSLMVNVTNLYTGGGALSTNTVVVLTNDAGIFQTVGGGDHYLANGSPYQSVGSTNINSSAASDIADGTTYPPIVYTNKTFSVNTNFSPEVRRDTNGMPDLGYHYCAMDYVFSGCDTTNNLSFTPGTIIGWYQGSGNVLLSGGEPYGICLNDGGAFSAAGTVTSPCWFVSYNTVQECDNTNWSARGDLGGIVLNGSATGVHPAINAKFTKWSLMQSMANFYCDNLAYGNVYASDCEYYGGAYNSYRPSMYYTNCLFFRDFAAFWDQTNADSFAYQNCTFYNGILIMERSAGQAASFWKVADSSFDGTAFAWSDNLSGNTNDTYFDHNAYNTNNLDWQTYPYSSLPTNGTLETVGLDDLYVTNFNWQSSWFGDFYLPTNSLLVDKGNTTADQLGLYHYTTQTSQVPETNSIVDIGYHYVATDQYGNPLDSNGDGIPDYIEDANGNGLVDNGETDWALGIFTQPVSQTVWAGTSASFSVFAGGVGSLHYDWQLNGTAVPGATNATLTLSSVQTNNAGSYSVIVSDNYGMVTSSVATLTVLAGYEFTNFCDLTNLVINGDGVLTNTADGCVLELTRSAPSNSSSAFLQTPVFLANAASFSTFFSFRLSNPGGAYDPGEDGLQGADGIVFMLQTVTNNVGGNGGGLGYFSITNSVAVEFDTWYNAGYDPLLPDGNGDGNHVGVDFDGSIISATTAHIATPMNNGNVWYAWIDFDGSTSNLQVRLSETNSRPVSPVLACTVDMLSHIKTNSAYIGFSAGTGGSWNQQDILSWNINASYNPIGITNPSVTITSPINQTLLVGSNAMITAVVTNYSSSFAVNYVQFFTGTNSIGYASSTNNTYQLGWYPVSSGTNVLTAVAVNTNGYRVSSVPVTNYVRNIPVVTIITPTNGQVFSLSPTNITIQATATADRSTISNVVFYAGTNVLGSTNAGSPFTITWNTNYGIYTLTAKAADTNGATDASHPVGITVNPNNRPPSVYAGPNQTTNLPIAELTGFVTDDGLPSNYLSVAWSTVSGPTNSTVTFGNSNQPVTTATFSTNGIYVLQLFATDGQLPASNNVTVTVLVTNSPPYVNAGTNQVFILPALPGTNQVIPIITLQPLVEATNNGGGIDYFAPSNSAVFAMFQGDQNVHLDLLSQSGTTTNFVTVSNAVIGFKDGEDEDYLATVRDASHGFQVGDIFFGNDLNGDCEIVRVGPDGVNHWTNGPHGNAWVILTNAPAGYVIDSLWVDDTGVYGGDLLVLACGGSARPPGEIWRINASGTATLVASNLNAEEGITTIPNNVQKYGPWAGKILVGGDYAPISAVDTNGNVSTFDFGIGAECIRRILPGENLLVLVDDQPPIYAAPADEFQQFQNDILIADETDGYSVVYRAHWDGGQFEVVPFNTVPSEWAELNFTPEPLVNLPTNYVVLNGVVRDDGELFAPTSNWWTQISGPDAATIGDPIQTNTYAIFDEPGTNVFRLSAYDGQFTSYSDTTVVVKRNGAPAAYAGTNFSTGSFTNISLVGTGSDDGLPYHLTNYLWTLRDGAGQSVTILNATNASAILNVTNVGVYILRLTVDDGQATNFAEVQVTVGATNIALSPALGYPTEVGNSYTVNATVLNANNLPVTNQPVQFAASDWRGGFNVASGTVYTSSNGVAQFTYSRSQPGEDAITATLVDTNGNVINLNGQPVSAYSTKYWARGLVCGGLYEPPGYFSQSISWPTNGLHYADFYIINLTNGEPLTIDFANYSPAALILRDPSGQVAVFDSGGPLNYVAQSAGDYVVEVAEADQNNLNYQLGIHCNTPFQGNSALQVFTNYVAVANFGTLCFPLAPTTNQPQQLSLMLTNAGALDLIISNITITGDFSNLSSSGYYDLLPNGVVNLQLQFNASSNETAQGQLTIFHNAPWQTNVYYLSASAYAPQLEIFTNGAVFYTNGMNMPSLVFPATTSGSPTTMTLSITNPGTSNLVISNMLVGTGFTNLTGTNFTIPPTGGTNVVLQFNAASNGLFGAEVQFGHNAQGGQFAAALIAAAGPAGDAPTLTGDFSVTASMPGPSPILMRPSASSSNTNVTYINLYQLTTNGLTLLANLTNDPPTPNEGPWFTTSTNFQPGTYTFTASACDSLGRIGIMSPGVATLIVPTNVPPTCYDWVITIGAYGQTHQWNPSVTDGSDTGIKNVVSITPPLYGTAVLDTNPASYTYSQITYTSPDSFGSDYFTYTVSDGNGGLTTANIFVVVQDPDQIIGRPQIGVLSGGTNVTNGGSLAFPTTVTNSPETMTLTVTNSGTDDLLITNISLSGDFTNLTGTNFDIHPGASTNLIIQFNASASEVSIGQLLIQNNAMVQSFDVFLNGSAFLPGPLPGVSIVSPANGSTNFSPAMFSIVAQASSTVTNISYVDLQQVTPAGTFDLGNFTSSSGVYVHPIGMTNSGDYTFQAVAVDAAGRQSTSRSVVYHILPNSETNPPVANDDSFRVLANSVNNILKPLANDTNPNPYPLTITSITAPENGTARVINNGTAIAYTPDLGIRGYTNEPADGFQYTISDNHGGTASATVSIYIDATDIPDLTLGAASYSATAGTSDPIYATNTTGNPVKVDFYQGQNLIGEVTNQTGGVFTLNWTANYDPGDTHATIYAGATDQFGQVGIATPITVNVSAPANGGAAVATLDSITGSLGTTPLIGTNLNLIRDGRFQLNGRAYHNLGSNVTWQVGVYTIDGTLIRQLSPVTSGTIGTSSTPATLMTCDLTTLLNGIYDLRLTVNGGYTTAETNVEIQLESNLKIGQFGFSQQDLIIPVNGVPLTVTRTYNSLNLNEGDFGYGWTYALDDLNASLDETRQDVTDTDGNDFSERSGGGWDVTLTLPNGQVTTFTFNLVSGANGTYYAQWDAAPGVTAKLGLQPGTQNALETLVGGMVGDDSLFYWDAAGPSTPWQEYDFPGFVLTTLDGTQYYLNRDDLGDHFVDDGQEGTYVQAYGNLHLSKVVERNGDVVTISPSSIVYNATNGATRQVVFTRNDHNLITSVSDPNSLLGGGSTNPAAIYQYDDNDNLIDVLNLVDRNAGTYVTNSFSYTNINFPHFITGIINADGTPVAQNFYDDSGKLIAVQDANGNLTQFIDNPTNNTDVIIDRLGYTNTYVYDLRGNVIAQTNQLGQITEMAYDANNNKTNEVTFLNGVPYATNSYVYDTNNDLLVSTDPLGHTNSSVYDGFGNVLTNTDAKGNSTVNTYDGSGNLIQTMDALSNNTYNFYSGGLLMGSEDAIGTVTTNYYDGSENLIATATLDASGTILSSNSYTYDNNANRLTSTVWRRVNGSWTSATTASIYDAMNRVVQTVNPDGGTNTVVYDPTGKQSATIDPLGRITSYVYDSENRLIQTVYADGTSESAAYDSNGNRTNSTDRAGHATTSVYDALNRQVETIYVDGSTNATVYDGIGRTAQSIDALGHITAYSYDVAGRRLAVTNALQQVTSYTYDANGNQLTMTDANNHSTTNVYDLLNRQIQVQYPDGTAEETVYDAAGRKVAATNQDSIVTLFGYDGAGKLTSVTNVIQGVTRYNYDEAGNEIAQIDALKRTNVYSFDGMGRRIAHAMPGSQVESFGYDLAGNLQYTTNFNGAIITNLYDANNRLTNVSSIGYKTVYTYTATGQRQTMNDASGSTAYTYDNRDRLQLKTVNWQSGPTVSLYYQYNANGNLLGLGSSTSGGVTNTYQYDSLNRLTNVLANGSPAAGYAFDPAGNLQAMRYGNGVTNLYQYDSLNRLTNAAWKLNASTLASFYYQVGLTGNRTNLIENVNGTARTNQWQYDALYRLTNEVIKTASTATLGYGYDPVGNRTNRNVSGLSLTNQSFTLTTNDWLNSDTYDSNGNTTTSGTSAYHYDALNHLTNLNNAVYITYNGDGDRMSKTVGGVTTYYLVDDQNLSGYAQVLEEYQGSTLGRVYNYGLSLISQRVPGTSTNYFVYDGHGSTRLLADAGGNVANAFAYDAYGNLIASNGTPQTLYLYCGEQFDLDLGQSYNRARYLDFNVGRFATSDNYQGDNEDPSSLHKYFYAECDPVDSDDPSGNAAFSSADSAAIGRQVHQIIGQDFTKDGEIAGRWTGSTIFTIAKVPNPVKKMGQKLGRIFPDLVDANTREIYEIKPMTVAGTAAGFAQLYAYVVALNKLLPPATWKFGESYDYKGGAFSLLSPPSEIVVLPTVSGMIYYEAFTVQQLGRAGAKIVGRSDMNDLNQSLGVATLITIL